MNLQYEFTNRTEQVKSITFKNTVSIDNVEKITYNINKTDNGKNYFANKVLVSDESDT